MPDLDEVVVTATVPTYIYNPLIGTGTSVSPSSPYTAQAAQSSWYYKQYLKKQAEKKLKQLQDDIDAIDMSHLLSDEDPLLELTGNQLIFDGRSGTRALNIDDIVINIPSYILGDITINPESSNYAHYVQAYRLGSLDYNSDDYIALERAWAAVKDSPTPNIDRDKQFVSTGDSTTFQLEDILPNNFTETVSHVVDETSKTLVNVTNSNNHFLSDGFVTLTITKDTNNYVYLVVGEIREIKGSIPKGRDLIADLGLLIFDPWENYANELVDDVLELQNPIPEL